MYIAMNRFKVRKGSEEAFEEIWRLRESWLPGMEGFRSFHLLRGPEDAEGGHTLFATHTTWDSEAAFIAWTESEGFRASHRKSGSGPLLTERHPQFEGFAVVEGV